MPNMFTLKSVTYDEDRILRERGLEKGGEVQRFMRQHNPRGCRGLSPGRKVRNKTNI